MRKRNTNRATAFSRDLQRKLSRREKFNNRMGVKYWRMNWPLPNTTHETVDVAGIRDDGSPAVLIEAELLRDDPANNVVKVWKWAEKNERRQRFLFLQAFSKAYLRRKRRQRANAQFIAKRMLKEISKVVTYKQVRLNYNPRPGAKIDGGRRQHQAYNLAYSVIRLGRSMPRAL